MVEERDCRVQVFTLQGEAVGKWGSKGGGQKQFGCSLCGIAVSSVQCSVYSVEFTVWRVQCGVYSVECTVWSV